MVTLLVSLIKTEETGEMDGKDYHNKVGFVYGPCRIQRVEQGWNQKPNLDVNLCNYEYSISFHVQDP